jgi:hypothetical protein
MVDDWYLQSKESLIKERNRTRATQSRDEIEEPSGENFTRGSPKSSSWKGKTPVQGLKIISFPLGGKVRSLRR